MSEPTNYSVQLVVTPGSDNEISLLVFLARFLPADEWAKVRSKIGGHVRDMPIRVLSLAVPALHLAQDMGAETVGQLAAMGRSRLMAHRRNAHHTTLDGIERRLTHFGVTLEP